MCPTRTSPNRDPPYPMTAPRFPWRRWLQRLLLSLPLLFLLLFYIYPLNAILRVSLAPDGRLETGVVQQLISRPYLRGVLWFTVWQATLSTGLTLLLALPGAYIFATYTFRGRRTLLTLSALPFVLPTVVVATAFMALLGPDGLINNFLMRLFNLSAPPIQVQQTIGIILLAHVFYNYSVALRLITAYWQNLSPELSQAAYMLGATPWRAFWRVTWPLLRPAVLAAGALVFMFNFTSFGVIVILGGPRFATLEVEIYRQAVNLFNLPLAAALALLQIVFTLGLMIAYSRTQAHLARPRQIVSARSVQQPVRDWPTRVLVGANLGLMALLLGAPLLALAAGSLLGEQGLTGRFYHELFINRRQSLFFAPPAQAIANSVGFALTTVVLATTLGLLATALLTSADRYRDAPVARRRLLSWLDPIFMLPLATSAVTLGLGYILALGKPPLNLRHSWLLPPIAHTLVALPFVLRAVLPAMRRISPSLREVAALLGAPPEHIWWAIDWPLVRRAVLVGAVFAFTISLGEFGATIFIVRPETPTLPVAIFRFLGQPGALNFGQALAMSNVLLLVCAAGFVLIERWQLGGEGEF